MNLPEEFEELQARVFELYGEGAYRKALDLVEESRGAFPNRAGRLSFWAACLWSRLNQSDEAMEELRQAVRSGFWSPEMFRMDPDLKPLREREDFQALLRECDRLRKAAQAEARPDLLVERPPDYDATEPSPLLLALHGRGGNAREALPHWREALAVGAILALPQSSQVMGSESFSWDDPELTRQELRVHHQTLRRDYPLDPSSLLLAGYSQGGARAISLALRGEPGPVRAFLAVAPSPVGESETVEAAIEGAARRGVRGWILTGEGDQALKSTRELHAFLESGGVDCELHVEPGIGHQFPPGFASRLREVLASLL